jgi:hypothetical protein
MKTFCEHRNCDKITTAIPQFCKINMWFSDARNKNFFVPMERAWDTNYIGWPCKYMMIKFYFSALMTAISSSVRPFLGEFGGLFLGESQSESEPFLSRCLLCLGQ